jgi:hypothetical protein
MYCTNCGKEVPNTAKVCGYCGQRLRPRVTRPVTPARQIPSQRPAPVERPVRKAIPPQPEPEPVKPVQPMEPEPVEPEPPQKSVAVERPVREVPAPRPEPEQVQQVEPEPKPVEPEPTPKPVPVEKPAHEAAPPQPEPELVKPVQPAKSKFVESKSTQKPIKTGKNLTWVWWVLSILIILAGAFALSQTQGWFAKEAFSGAIGKWESRDSSDGSRQTLSIRRTLKGEYRLEFYDEHATTCGKGSASATMIAKTSSATLNTRMQATCNAFPGKKLHTYNVLWTYNPIKNILIDSWSDTWTRQ